MADAVTFSRPVRKQTLAEQMAETIREAILSGELAAGADLPTESQLCEQFGVSRAVVRDATRILMAQGLVTVAQGRGVTVTETQNEAFGDALLIALRRAGATVWDVEQFEQLLFPEVVALAATAATDAEIVEVRELVEAYLALFKACQAQWAEQTPPATVQEELRHAFQRAIRAIFDATHNRVLQQLASPLVHLRSLRRWEDAAHTGDVVALESAYLHTLVDALAGRDPDAARRAVARLMQLPEYAVAAMRATPVGEIAVIRDPENPHP
ncbi:MAG TPA: GntR family transcriptional regulator [Anaerolineae bacterium]|nr:GntR family transcriptional regulator [Anaerolineae bacterium]HQI87422.1 GntR family transcriptional regulator [Anaerolineae bacterium]